MKTKNIYLTLLFLSMNVIAFAQIKVSELDAITRAILSSAFLDATSAGATYNNSDILGKGIIFPRTDLTKLTAFFDDEFSPTVGSTGNYLTFFDGFVVYNIAESGKAYIGDTEGTLSPGFWYYDNKSGILTGGTWKPLGGGGNGGSTLPNVCINPPYDCDGDGIPKGEGEDDKNPCDAVVTGLSAPGPITITAGGSAVITVPGTGVNNLRDRKSTRLNSSH